MIVEITGVPGSGKTTLLQSITNKYNEKLVLFSDDLVLKHFRLDFIGLNIPRRVLGDAILFLIFLRHFYRCRPFMFQAISLLAKSRERMDTKLNVLRNIILKLGRFHFIEKNFVNKIVLVDEGISHIPFILTDYSGENEIDIKSVLEPLSAQVSKVRVVILDHELIDVKLRLDRRGHKRVEKRKSSNFLNRFVYLNNKVINGYKSLQEMRFLDKKFLKVGTDNDAEKFMQIINS